MLKEMTECASLLATLKQGDLGWLYSSTNNIVSHKNPKTRKEIQDKLDFLVGNLGLVYLFTIFDSFFESGNSKITKPKDLYEEYMTDNGRIFNEDYEKFLAFRHVRNSVVHNFDGTRANTYILQFDNVMNRPNLKERIIHVTILSDGKIKTSKGIVLEFLGLLEKIVGRIQVYSSSSNL
ncbi:MAG: hypothetical protein ABII85_05365 [Bacillota bacterium]